MCSSKKQRDHTPSTKYQPLQTCVLSIGTSLNLMKKE